MYFLVTHRLQTVTKCSHFRENSSVDANKVEEPIIDATTSADTNTKETTKKGFSAKLNPISADMCSDVFPLWTSAKKRKGKTLKLKNKKFEVDTTKRQTQVGFVTTRPIRWALALEAYITANPDIKCNWHYKTNQKTRKYTECYVILNHHIFTVHVNILFSTGVFFVEGDHKYWTQNEFPKILELFELQQEPDNGEVVDPDEKQFDELYSSVDCLWKKIDELTAAIKLQDDVIQKVMDRAQEAELRINENNPKLITLEAEKVFDKKLAAFMDFMSEDLEKGLKKLEIDVNTKIQNLHTKIDQMYQPIRDEIQDIKSEVLSMDEKTIEGVHSKLKEIDNSIQKEIRENPTKTLVHDLEEKFQEHSEEISSLQEDIRKATNSSRV